MTFMRFGGGAVLGAAVMTVSTAAVGSPPPGGNRLKWEMSPYLLRHADDPVDWYPWGPEGFAAAREQDKPIFLSIGYTSCCWCHVMERESFEDAATAAVLNADYIAIIVDREERPDVDAIYTAAVKAMTGSGGWPLSVFIDPRSLEPFAGGTYYPAQPRGATPSFRQVLQSVTEQWKTDRQGVASRAADVAGQVRVALSSATQSVPAGREQVDEAVSSILEGYDPVDGGFQRGAPKFARPPQLELLLAAARSDAVAREAVLHTLDRMAIGGFYDQVAGGFHRYSTDEQWLVPHFEKMLYDNAQLARVYTRAYQLTGDAFYAHIARETLEYLLRETYGPYGAFFGAQDAEADGREGASYVWTSEQVFEALTLVGLEQDVGFALEVYGLNDGPNFRDPRHPEDEPANVLHLADRPEAVAAGLGMTGTAFDTRLAGVKQALLSMRSERGDPLIDDKVITEWNGLMMVTLVEAAQAFGEPRYQQAAEKTGLFLLGRVRTHDGWLARSWRADIGQIRAFSGDYAQCIAGLIALHRASGAAESKWLISAETYAEEAKGLFLDPATGAFYDTRKDQPDLFVRPRAMADRVMPCPTSTMILNLLDLYEITGEDQYRDDAEAMIKGLGGRLKEDPASLPVAAMAVQRFAERGTVRPVRPAVAAGTGPLVARVSRAAITVGPGSPGRFEVTLDIGDGYHVTAHDPGSPLLTGLQLRLIGPGLELSADYPAGEAFRTAGFGQAISVYTGVVTIPVTITQKAAWKGAPRLVLTYQVCTDAACLKPERTVLTLKLTQG